MKKYFTNILFFKLIFLITSTGPALAAGSTTSGNTDEKQDITAPDRGPLQSALAGIKINGGISAGYFYASNPGEDTSDDAFLLSNFLVEISSSDKSLPVEFVGAFGETSTPSLLDTPENNSEFRVEYASLALKPVNGLSLEAGLLRPNAGYENTYTYNNRNIILGAVASQQPYNAYGARIGYEVNGLCLWGGYYTERLDDEEYNSPDAAWEIGLSTPVGGSTFSLYHYHIKGQRNLSGAIIERSIHDIGLAFVVDYWRWDSSVKNLYGSRSAIGGSLYICPGFGRFSIPLRLEYINQNKSRIFIESPNTKYIYTVTVSPTWHFNEKTYIRAESAYVKADEAFADKDGRIRDNRINLAIEAGYMF